MLTISQLNEIFYPGKRLRILIRYATISNLMERGILVLNKES